MKGKGAASLYEVLKTASRPAGDPAGAAAAPAATPPGAEGAGPSQTLQERLAAYKAQKLAEANSPSPAPEPVARPVEAPATAVAEMTPPPAPRIELPAPPPPRPATIATPTLVLPPPPVSAAPVSAGPGERTARLTWNTVAFAALVVVGLIFVAYAVGVSSGRRRAAVEAGAEPAAPPRPAAQVRASTPVPPPPPPPPPSKVYTVWLAEWRYGANSERVKADDAVRQLKAALDRANLKGVEVMKVQRGAEPRLAMYIDRLGDPGSAETKARLAAFQKFKFGTQLPFAQAAVVELPK